METLNEAEMFRTVLNEMLGELKQLAQGAKEANKNLSALQEKFMDFHQRLENLKVVAPETDLTPVHDTLKEGITELNKQMTDGMGDVRTTFTQHLQKLTEAVEAQPKRIVRTFSLFPENDRRGSYKYFIKALFLSILGVLLIGGAYSLIKQSVDEHTEERRYLMTQRSAQQAPAQPSPAPQRKKVKVKVAVEDTTTRTDY